MTVVDIPAAIEAARATAQSIELDDRFDAIEGNPLEASLPSDSFDLVVIAQRISCLSAEQVQGPDAKRPSNATAAKGGRIVVIDLFRGPATPAFGGND